MGFWSNFDPFYSKGALGSVTSGVAKPLKNAVKWTGRQIDVTSSKSFGGAGRYIAPIARPAIGTMAAAVTGGASVLAGERGLISRSTFGTRSTAQGYSIGAGVGLAVLGGKTIGQATAGALRDSIAGGGADGGERAPVSTGGQENATATGEPFLTALLRFMFPGREVTTA